MLSLSLTDSHVAVVVAISSTPVDSEMNTAAEGEYFMTPSLDERHRSRWPEFTARRFAKHGLAGPLRRSAPAECTRVSTRQGPLPRDRAQAQSARIPDRGPPPALP